MSSTRHFYELRVGKTHTVEVLLYVRRKHLEWFSQHSVKGQVFRLLSTRVIPREFYAEIERYHQKVNRITADVETKAGEGNETSWIAKISTGKAKGKRKRNSKPAPPVVVPDDKPRRDIRHVHDDNVQLTYRLQDLDVSSRVTISVSSVTDNRNQRNLSFRQYPKLSKRLVAWCSPPSNPDDDDLDQETMDGGFPRTELVPIAALFQPLPKST